MNAQKGTTVVKAKKRFFTPDAERKNPYEHVTERIVQIMEKEGTIPWHKPWSAIIVDGKAIRGPFNAKSKQPYRGINALALAILPYDDPRFVTFKQAKELCASRDEKGNPVGGVRKGEKGHRVIFWKKTSWEDENDAGEQVERHGMFAKSYVVFNVEQCDNLILPDLVRAQVNERNDQQVIAEAERVVENMRLRPTMHESLTCTQAAYSPALDLVKLPHRSTFDSMPHFYATQFHELGHATGHADRLNRREIVAGGSLFCGETYGTEELTAEIASAYLCSEVGIANGEILTNAAAYVAHWLAFIKSDPKAMVNAASRAHAATDWILGRRAE